MQKPYLYTEDEKRQIFDWACIAGFSLHFDSETQVSLFWKGCPIAKLTSEAIYDRLVAEIAQIAARRVVFHFKEHAFVTLKKLKPETLINLLQPSV